MVFVNAPSHVYHHACCRFWKEPVPFTPESRAETHSYIAEKRREKGKETGYGYFPSVLSEQD